MNQPKRVLCIHDLAALGRASLSAILPTLAACGCQPVALPTALLSVHTGGLGQPTVSDLSTYGPRRWRTTPGWERNLTASTPGIWPARSRPLWWSGPLPSGPRPCGSWTR